MTSFKILITPEAKANFLVQFLLDENSDNQKFAREQILALCQFYDENKPEEEDGVTSSLDEHGPARH